MNEAEKYVLSTIGIQERHIGPAFIEPRYGKCVVVGINPRAHKNPVRIKNVVNGKFYNSSPYYVLAGLRQAGVK